MRLKRLSGRGLRIGAQPRSNSISSTVAIQHHPVFYRFAPQSGPAQPGFEVDFLGCRSRHEFWPAALRTGVPQTSYPPVDEEYPEWIDLLESAVAARGSYTMVEAGAGFGRWSVRAAQAVRQFSGLPFHLVAIEPEPQHFEWLAVHLRDNGIDPAEHRLIEAAVTAHTGEALFCVRAKAGRDGSPAEWYGQALMAAEGDQVVGQGKYRDRRAREHRSGRTSIGVRTISLQQILSGLERVDLLDIDIQGEELNAASAAIDEITRCVKRLHIGTHSREIENGLRKLLSEHGWECLADYKCSSKTRTPWGQVLFTDGVQSWGNRRLS